MSPAELAKSEIGRGIRVEVYSYHFKKLELWGLLEVLDGTVSGQIAGTRYMVTAQLTQAVIDAAALGAITDVLRSIPKTLAKWIDEPFIEKIGQLVRASGRDVN